MTQLLIYGDRGARIRMKEMIFTISSELCEVEPNFVEFSDEKSLSTITLNKNTFLICNLDFEVLFSYLSKPTSGVCSGPLFWGPLEKRLDSAELDQSAY